MIEKLTGRSGPMPDLSGWGSRYKRVAAQQQKVNRTVGRWHRAGAQAMEIDAKLRELEVRYDQSLEDAALEVEEAEDPQKLEQEIGALQNDLDRAQRNAQACKRAVDSAASEMARLVQADSGDLMSEADKRIQKLAEKYLKSVDELVVLEHALSDCEHIKEWIERPETAMPAGVDNGRYNALEAVRNGVQHALEKATQGQQEEVPA